MNPSFKALAILALAAISVVAETHSVFFDNRCEDGIPTLILQNGDIIKGDVYKSDGPLTGATAFLGTEACGPQGEGCTAVKIKLTNTGSNVGITLAPPYWFSVPTSFRYDYCNSGAKCNDPDCPDASRTPWDTNGQVACDETYVSIFITFCDSFENKLFVNS